MADRYSDVADELPGTPMSPLADSGSNAYIWQADTASSAATYRTGTASDAAPSELDDELARHPPINVASTYDEAMQQLWTAVLESGNARAVHQLLSRYRALLQAQHVARNLATPAHLAASSGFVGVLRVLSQAHGADIGAADAMRTTPLHYAAEAGRVDAVQWLLSCGADPDSRDYMGCPPLFSAVRAGHCNCARALAVSRALVNATNLMGETALHLAARGRNVAMFRLLIDAGASPLIADLTGRPPLDESDSTIPEEMRSAAAEASVRQRRWDEEARQLAAVRDRWLRWVESPKVISPTVGGRYGTEGFAFSQALLAHDAELVEYAITHVSPSLGWSDHSWGTAVFACAEHDDMVRLLLRLAPIQDLGVAMQRLAECARVSPTNAGLVTLVRSVCEQFASTKLQTCALLGMSTGNVELTQWLLARGANPNARGHRFSRDKESQSTVLSLASTQSQAILLEHGAAPERNINYALLPSAIDRFANAVIARALEAHKFHALPPEEQGRVHEEAVAQAERLPRDSLHRLKKYGSMWSRLPELANHYLSKGFLWEFEQIMRVACGQRPIKFVPERLQELPARINYGAEENQGVMELREGFPMLLVVVAYVDPTHCTNFWNCFADDSEGVLIPSTGARKAVCPTLMRVLSKRGLL